MRLSKPQSGCKQTAASPPGALLLCALCCHCRCCSLLLLRAVPMRVGEFSMRVQEVKLSLFAGNSMYQPKPEVGRYSSYHFACAS
jgi:hypothetical protein